MEETNPESTPVEADAGEAESVETDVEIATDPRAELECLRATGRWWKRTALGAVAVCAALFVLSSVQLIGVFVNQDLLHKAREEAAQSRQEAEKKMEELRDIQAEVRRAREAASRQDSELKEQSKKADLVHDLKAERDVLLTGIELLRTLQRDEEKKLRELERVAKEKE
jgi:hypothetical protein